MAVILREPRGFWHLDLAVTEVTEAASRVEVDLVVAAAAAVAARAATVVVAGARIAAAVLVCVPRAARVILDLCLSLQGLFLGLFRVLFWILCYECTTGGGL